MLNKLAAHARLFHQSGLERDVHPGKSLRDRAILLGAVGQLLELSFVDSGYLTLCRELDCGYLEPFADFFKLCSRGRLDSLRDETRLRKPVRESHGKTSSVSGRNELLGICSLTLFEP